MHRSTRRRGGKVAARGTLLAALGVACALAACGDGRDGAERGIALADCRLPRLAVAARCGTLAVPEDRSRPDGRRIEIAVAVLPANTLTPKPDPLVILAGGPGQAATRLGPFAAQLVDVRRDRDIVLVDQRGTGRSSALDCAAWRANEQLAAVLDVDPAPEAVACAKELAARGVDPRQYTTAAFVADLDAVRAGLGYDRVNLWGGSYGTRAALEYLRRHPQRVRSMVLDGVVPPGMTLTLDVWPTRAAAQSAVLAACAASNACRAAHPDLGATLAKIGERLGTAGREVTFTDPRTGEARTLRLGFDQFLAALQSALYVPELASLLPDVIAEAAADDFGPLLAVASFLTGEVARDVDTALYYSVACADDAARLTPEHVAAALAGVEARALAERLVALCKLWPHGDAPPDAASPVTSDVPVLLLSGGLDPVTPPDYAATVARTLRNSRQVLARGYGHIVSAHACAPRLIAAFVADPAAGTLPTACVEHFETSVRPPLWPNRLGAAP